jgi:hypothetical protein
MRISPFTERRAGQAPRPGGAEPLYILRTAKVGYGLFGWTIAARRVSHLPEIGTRCPATAWITPGMTCWRTAPPAQIISLPLLPVEQEGQNVQRILSIHRSGFSPDEDRAVPPAVS